MEKIEKVAKDAFEEPTKKEGLLSRSGKYVKGSFTKDALLKGSLGQRGVQGAALLAVGGGLYGSKKLYDKSKSKKKNKD